MKRKSLLVPMFLSRSKEHLLIKTKTKYLLYISGCCAARSEIFEGEDHGSEVDSTRNHIDQSETNRHRLCEKRFRERGYGNRTSRIQYRCS